MHGLSLELDGSFGKAEVSTQLLGRFNAENSLVVIACLLSLGASLRRGCPRASPSASLRRAAWK